MIDILLRVPTSHPLIQLFRYTFVGGMAFVVDFGSLILLTEYVGMHYLISAAIAFVLGLLTNYVLSVSWVFNRRSLSNRGLEFLLFAGIGGIGLVFNELGMWLLTDFSGWHYGASKILTAILVYLWNFIVRRTLLFR